MMTAKAKMLMFWTAFIDGKILSPVRYLALVVAHLLQNWKLYCHLAKYFVANSSHCQHNGPACHCSHLFSLELVDKWHFNEAGFNSFWRLYTQEAVEFSQLKFGNANQNQSLVIFHPIKSFVHMIESITCRN